MEKASARVEVPQQSASSPPASAASPLSSAARSPRASGVNVPGGAPDSGRAHGAVDEPGAAHVHSGPAASKVPQRHSVRAQVLAALREALLSGRLSPGEVYSAPALAARFGTSPTPVREAMQQLVSEGWVTTVPNRGFRVAERTARECAEIAEVRSLLEVPAVLAIARAQPAESWEALRPLADAVFDSAMRGDLAGHAAADQAFHRALLELGGNGQLTQLAEELCRRARQQAPDVAELRARAGRHGALLDALGAGDLTLAEAELRELLAA